MDPALGPPIFGPEPQTASSPVVSLWGNCTTVECGVGHLASFSFSLFWSVFSDPIGCSQRTWVAIVGWICMNISVISWMLGACLLFCFSNLLIYGIKKFATVCSYIKQAVVLVSFLPIVECFMTCVRFLWGLCFRGAKEAKTEWEALRQENKELKSTVDKLAILMQKVGEGAERAKEEEIGRAHV